MRVLLRLACFALVAQARAAAAETVVEAAPQPAPEDAFPHQATARPLVLPAGALEATFRIEDQHLGVGGTTTDTASGVIGGRARFGLLEVEASAKLFLFDVMSVQTGILPPERFTAASFAARYALSPNKTFGLELTYFNSAADSAYAPRFALAGKKHLSPIAAVVAAGYFGGSNVGSDAGVSWVTFAGDLRVQAQVACGVMLEGGSYLAFNKIIGDTQSSPLGSFFSQTFGLHTVLTISRAFDFVGGVEIVHSSDTDSQLFTVGVQTRRLP